MMLPVIPRERAYFDLEEILNYYDHQAGEFCTQEETLVDSVFIKTVLGHINLRQAALTTDQVFKCLALTDHVVFITIDHDLGRTCAAVVIGSHHKAIRAC